MASPVEQAVTFTETDLLKKTNAVLRSMCKTHDPPLKVGGNKKELVRKLRTPEPEDYIKPPKTCLEARIGTSLYECWKDAAGLINNPTFTKEHKKRKDEIFENTGTTCFVTKKTNKGVGDHICGIRERHAQGFIGGNDEWNTVCVHGSINKTYKLVTIDGTTFHLGYDELNDEQIQKLTNEQRTIYNKILQWKHYCRRQGAKIYMNVGIEKVKEFEKEQRELFESYCKNSKAASDAFWNNHGREIPGAFRIGG